MVRRNSINGQWHLDIDLIHRKKWGWKKLAEANKMWTELGCANVSCFKSTMCQWCIRVGCEISRNLASHLWHLLKVAWNQPRWEYLQHGNSNDYKSGLFFPQSWFQHTAAKWVYPPKSWSFNPERGVRKTSGIDVADVICLRNEYFSLIINHWVVGVVTSTWSMQSWYPSVIKFSNTKEPYLYLSRLPFGGFLLTTWTIWHLEPERMQTALRLKTGNQVLEG